MTIIHEGDIIEEVSTARQGTVKMISCEGPVGRTLPSVWHVQFSDGKVPVTKSFTHLDELRLVHCPHSSGEPSIVPEQPLADH